MEKKIKILFILAQMVGGGAERVTINILRMLDRKVFDIHLTIMNKEGPSFEYLPKDITLHDLNVRKTMFSIFKLRKNIFDVNPDVVYSTLFRTHKALYFALQGIKNKPIILMRSPNSPKLLLENKNMGVFEKFLLERAYIKADIVLAQTPEMKNEIMKYHHIDQKKIQVFLNPLDTDSIDEKIKNIETPFNTKYVNIVAAGRLIEQKGFDILIKSFKKVIDRNSNFRLYIIGEDVVGKLESLEYLVDSLGLNPYIHFLGYQKNPYLYFYFSDLYVLSSRWEGLPNTVMENLYLKKPIIATRCIPFMDKLITNGINGLLVDVENIDQLANAILRYNEIDIKKCILLQDKSSINELFTKVLEKS